MRATMTTNVVVAVVLFATAGAHAQECTRKLIAMLKAWKIKSQFSRLDDLIFPNCEGQHLGHDNFIKRQFLPLFDLLPTVKRFNWPALRHFVSGLSAPLRVRPLVFGSNARLPTPKA
jgi:hypothetical protein